MQVPFKKYSHCGRLNFSDCSLPLAFLFLNTLQACVFKDWGSEGVAAFGVGFCEWLQVCTLVFFSLSLPFSFFLFQNDTCKITVGCPKLVHTCWAPWSEPQKWKAVGTSARAEQANHRSPRETRKFVSTPWAVSRATREKVEHTCVRLLGLRASRYS